MKDALMNLLMAIIQLGVIAGLGYLIDYLYAKAGNEKVKKFYDFAKMAVKAAEMTLGGGQGAEKKAMAIKYLSEKIGGRLTEEDINVLVESAVQEMNQVLKNKNLEQ